MEVWLAGGFLPLLLLAWLSAGLTRSMSPLINVLTELDLTLQRLPQTGSDGTSEEMKSPNTNQDNGEEQNKGGVVMLNSSIKLVITDVEKAHTEMYTCRMDNTTNMYENGQSKQNKDANQPEESGTTRECRFKIWLENCTVKWCKPADQEMGKQANTTALQKNCGNPHMCAASTGICECGVFTASLNSTASGNGMQGRAHSCHSGTPHFNVTNKDTRTGPSFPLCIFIGLAVGTLLYMPIIGLLLWQRRRNRKGMPVTEGNQLNVAAPVTGTEDLTYANLKFEKKKTKPTSSDVIYTDIKSPPQKQSGGDAGDAKAGVDVSPKGDGK